MPDRYAVVPEAKSALASTLPPPNTEADWTCPVPGASATPQAPEPVSSQKVPRSLVLPPARRTSQPACPDHDPSSRLMNSHVGRPEYTVTLPMLRPAATSDAVSTRPPGAVPYEDWLG